MPYLQLYRASALFETIRHEAQLSTDYKLSLFDLQTSSYQALQRVLVSLGESGWGAASCECACVSESSGDCCDQIRCVVTADHEATAATPSLSLCSLYSTSVCRAPPVCGLCACPGGLVPDLKKQLAR